MAFLIAIAILLVIIAAWFLVNRAMAERVAAKHGGEPERALDDEHEPIPSTHLVTEDRHDEINPRDIPQDNPARQEAEERAGR